MTIVKKGQKQDYFSQQSIELYISPLFFFFHHCHSYITVHFLEMFYVLQFVMVTRLHLENTARADTRLALSLGLFFLLKVHCKNTLLYNKVLITSLITLLYAVF